MATLMDWVHAAFWNGIGVAIGINVMLPVVESIELFGGLTFIHNLIAGIVSGLFGVFSLSIFTNYLAI